MVCCPPAAMKPGREEDTMRQVTFSTAVVVMIGLLGGTAHAQETPASPSCKAIHADLVEAQSGPDRSSDVAPVAGREQDACNAELAKPADGPGCVPPQPR